MVPILAQPYFPACILNLLFPFLSNSKRFLHVNFNYCFCGIKRNNIVSKNLMGLNGFEASPCLLNKAFKAFPSPRLRARLHSFGFILTKIVLRPKCIKCPNTLAWRGDRIEGKFPLLFLISSISYFLSTSCNSVSWFRMMDSHYSSSLRAITFVQTTLSMMRNFNYNVCFKLKILSKPDNSQFPDSVESFTNNQNLHQFKF